MTPKELVQRAIDKARADMQYDLEQLELWYNKPQTNVDDELVDSFEESSLNHLIRLMTHHCQSRKGLDAVAGYTSSRGYQIGRIPGGYVISIDGKYSSTIPYLPKDIDEVLDEYCTMRQSSEI